MGSITRLARTAAGLALAGLVGATVPAAANEVAAGTLASGLRIHGPEAVLRDFCATDTDGRLWLTLPGGRRFELIPSTSDPAIANPGDGSFHPFDEAQVRAALAEVRYPLEGLDAEIFLLPYPRRGALESGAGRGLILLSPGVVRLSAEQQNAELVHELGHVVQYQWLPDGDARWAEYRRRRGIEDESRYHAGAMHADRPHEIFAEDFRALFGGRLATYSQSIENSSLESPERISGLEQFLLDLPGAPVARLSLRGANPARGPVSFALGGGQPVPLDLFDVTGRRVATLEPTARGAEIRWSWDGRGHDGRALPAGLLLARVRDARGATTKVGWLP